MKEIRLGLVDVLSKSQPPVLQWVGGQWRLWTSYHFNLDHGTYILLHPNGGLQRVSVLPDDSLSIANIPPYNPCNNGV